MRINNVFHHSLRSGDKIAQRADAMDKTAKLTYRWIDLIEVLTNSVSAPVKLLSSRMKILSDMFEATRFFGVASVLTSQNHKGVYYLQNKRNSWQKCVDRICLLAHTAFKMINGGNRYGLCDLGPILPSIKIFGSLTAFKFITDGFMVISSFFGIWDSALTLKRTKEEMKTINYKIEKWEYRPLQSALIRKGNQVEIGEMKTLCARKISSTSSEMAKTQAELNKVNSSISSEKMAKMSPEERQRVMKETSIKAKEISEKIAHMQIVKNKFEIRLSRLNTGDYESVANELDKKNADLKLKKWELMKNYAETQQTAHWLKIAASAAKIAVIALALSMIALGIWTAPWMVTLLSIGIISDSIGISKIFYETIALEDTKALVKEFKRDEQKRKLDELTAQQVQKTAVAA